MDNKIKKKSFFESLEMGFSGWFIVFMITTAVILLERYTGLEITNFYVRLLLYVISISLLCFWVGWILFGFGAVRKRKIIFLLVLVVCLLKACLTWGGNWKTQTVLYEDNDNSRHTIEFQMRGDWFAFGYKNRIVERKKIIPFFDITHDIDTMKLNKETWKRVDRKVNKLRLNNFNDEPSN